MQCDARAHGVSAEHEITLVTLRPQPAADPFGISLHIAACGAAEMSRKIRRETAAKMFELIAKDFGAGARSRAVQKNQLSHVGVRVENHKAVQLPSNEWGTQDSIQKQISLQKI